jgi:hypothetical protein
MASSTSFRVAPGFKASFESPRVRPLEDKPSPDMDCRHYNMARLLEQASYLGGIRYWHDRGI